MNSLFEKLQERFESHPHRHRGLTWDKVQQHLEGKHEKLAVLTKMEETGGEPDVIGFDETSGEFIFVDCSPESPAGRRSLCYDRAAWEKRKTARPENTVMDVAKEIGIEVLDQDQYRQLQGLGEFDTRTSSWIRTPPDVRKLGGAVFMDRRYGQVFVYHNGADSYYGARGFRGLVRV